MTILRKPGWAMVDDNGYVVGFKDQVSGVESVLARLNGTALVVDGNEVPFRAPIMGAKLALMGDSHLDRGRYISSIAEAYTAVSPLHWAQVLSGQKLRLIADFAVGGKTTQQILEEQLPGVLAAQPDVVMLSGGTNDVAVANITDPAITIANIEATWAALTSLGITVLTWTIPVYDPVVGGYTDAEKALLKTVNHWMRRSATQFPGVILVDAYALGIDPASATGAQKAGYLLSDYTHFTNRYAYQIGKALAAEINKMPLGSAAILSGGINDNCYVSGQSSNPQRLRNNTFTTTTGGTAGAGASGTVPQYWTVARGSGAAGTTVSVSTEARSDGFGNDLVLTITGDAAETMGRIDVSFDTWAYGGLAALDQLIGVFQLTINPSPVGWRGARLELAAAAAGGLYFNSYDGAAFSDLTTEMLVLPDGITGIYKTPPCQIPDAVPNNVQFKISVFVGAGATVVAKIGRPVLELLR